jgi:hypothetical protein
MKFSLLFFVGAAGLVGSGWSLVFLAIQSFIFLPAESNPIANDFKPYWLH